MRHLLVLAIAALWLVPGSGFAAAQEATPEAAAVERTNVRYFLPYTPDGLATGLSVSGEVSGSCLTESLAAVGRPDAWVCTEAESGDRYDPCFENPFGAMDEVSELACVESPFATDVIRFTLTEPLQRQKEMVLPPEGMIEPGPPMMPPSAEAPYQMPPSTIAPGDVPADGGEIVAVPAPMPAPMPEMMPPPMPDPASAVLPGLAEQPEVADEALDPLEIPWALELANGERCTLLTGATAVLAGQRMNYGCEGGGYVLGEVDQRRQVWTVSYLAADAFASDLVAVAVVWV
jgi:hypothetical protein